MVHDILLRFDEAGQAAKTPCSWKYVMAKVGITLQEEAPTIYEEICGTCMPERSAQANAVLLGGCSSKWAESERNPIPNCLCMRSALV